MYQIFLILSICNEKYKPLGPDFHFTFQNAVLELGRDTKMASYGGQAADGLRAKKLKKVPKKSFEFRKPYSRKVKTRSYCF